MAQVGELPERRRLKAALAEVDAPTISPLHLPYIPPISPLYLHYISRTAQVDAARAAEEARRKAALPPTKCFTIGCKSYAMDLGAERKQWEDCHAFEP